MRARLALLLTSVALVSCPPAQPEDAGLDASVDAPDDVAADIARPDVPRDAPADAPGDPAWHLLELDAPDWCRIEAASRPSDVYFASWSPCPGLTGCLELVDSPLLSGERFFGEGAAGWHEGVGYFGVIVASADGPTTIVVAATDGPARAAWRSARGLAEGTCSSSRPAVSPNTLAVNYWWITAGGSPTAEDQFHLGSWVQADQVEPLVFRSGGVYPPGNAVQAVVTSDTTAAFQAAPIGYIVVTEADRWALRSGPTGVVTGGLGDLFVHDHDVFFTSWYEGPEGSDVWLNHTAIDRVEHTLYHADGRLHGPDTDGSSICWVRLPEPGMLNGDLECAVYSVEEGELVPRTITTNVAGAGGRMGPGLYCTLDHDDESRFIDLVRLADGTRLRYRLAPEDRFTDRPFWVTDQEVAVAVRRAGDATVLRIQTDAFEVVP